MSDKIFGLLTANASFDRSRFQGDIEKFVSKRKTPDRKQSKLEAFIQERTTASKEVPVKQPSAKRQKLTESGLAKKSKKKPATSDLALFKGVASGEDEAAPGDEEAAGGRDDAAQAIRAQNDIKVTSRACPDPLTGFEDLNRVYGTKLKLLSNVAEAGWHEPTPIQRQAIPCLLLGMDVYAIAPTGSGKTLGFLLPGIISAMKARAAPEARHGPGPSMLVLNPTRELAAQTHRVLKLLLPHTGLKGSLLCKATAAGTAFEQVDILIATPLLLVEHLQGEKINLSGLKLIVLDEADKLFEAGKGFMEQVDHIFKACEGCTNLCRCLFSATLPDWVEKVASTVLQDPVHIVVGAKNAASANVAQKLLFVGREEGKLLALKQMIAEGIRPPVLAFVASKDRAKSLHKELKYDGLHVDSLHADQSQAARNAAVENFRAGKTWLLLATDLIGRGMDFLGVNTVVNYDFPQTTTDYIHRIGRTGRGGRQGEAVTFFVEDDAPRLRAIANCMRKVGCPVPDWMLLLKPGQKKATAGAVSVRSAFEHRQHARKAQIIQQSKKKRDRAKQQGASEGEAAEPATKGDKSGRIDTTKAGKAGSKEKKLDRLV